MKIRLTESQYNILTECMLKEAMMESFSFDTLRSIPSFAKRIEYCKQHLGNPIGGGSSRMVFQINDQCVLKLAKNPKGIAQNDAEYDHYVQQHHYDIVPIIYKESDDENYYFLVSEFVLPAKKNDFKHVLGITFEEFCNFIREVASCYTRMNPWEERMSQEDYDDFYEKNEEVVDSWYNYMTNMTPPYGDMLRIANYGLVKRYNDLYIVLLDSGLTDDVYNSYYKR